MKKTSFIICLCVIALCNAQINHEYMHSKEITRAIDLREKQNKPFMASGREITQLLLDAVQHEHINAYTSDSLQNGTRLTQSEFLERIALPQYGSEFDFCDNCEDDTLSSTEHYRGRDLYQLELTEDVGFNKIKSVQEYHIKYITLYIPADHPDNVRGIQEKVAVFDYNELTRLFGDQTMSVWFNPYNDAEFRTIAEAFKLRLFSSYIVAISNPDGDYIADQFDNPEDAIIQSLREAENIHDRESNYWEN